MRIGKVAIVLGLAGMIVATIACAGPRRFVATTARPVAIPLTSAPAVLGMTRGARYVEIVVTDFRPSPTGPVQIVVDAVTGKTHVELGRFGIYPERAFVTNDRAEPQYFSLPVPAGLRLEHATHLAVSIVPSGGDGAGATVAIESARLSRR